MTIPLRSQSAPLPPRASLCSTPTRTHETPQISVTDIEKLQASTRLLRRHFDSLQRDWNRVADPLTQIAQWVVTMRQDIDSLKAQSERENARWKDISSRVNGLSNQLDELRNAQDRLRNNVSSTHAIEDLQDNIIPNMLLRITQLEILSRQTHPLEHLQTENAALREALSALTLRVEQVEARSLYAYPPPAYDGNHYYTDQRLPNY